MIETKTIYYVDYYFRSHGPFSTRTAAEQFAIALAANGPIKDHVCIRPEQVEDDSEDDD